MRITTVQLIAGADVPELKLDIMTVFFKLTRSLQLFSETLQNKETRIHRKDAMNIVISTISEISDSWFVEWMASDREVVNRWH